MSISAQITADYLDNVRFEVHARGHRVRCDQPPHNGGQDDGMAPPELLLASLATCAGYYALQYLRTRGIPSGDLQVWIPGDGDRDSDLMPITIPDGIR